MSACSWFLFLKFKMSWSWYRPFWHIFQLDYFLYTNLACLGVFLFVSNKSQNGWTDRAQILCGTSRDHREVYEWLKLKKIVFRSFLVLKNFENARKKFMKFANFFIIFFYCTKRRCSQITPQFKVEIEDGRDAP